MKLMSLKKLLKYATTIIAFRHRRFDYTKKLYMVKTKWNYAFVVCDVIAVNNDVIEVAG